MSTNIPAPTEVETPSAQEIRAFREKIIEALWSGETYIVKVCRAETDITPLIAECEAAGWKVRLTSRDQGDIFRYKAMWHSLSLSPREECSS